MSVALEENFNILESVLFHMEQAEKFVSYSGEDKKKYVIQSIKMLMIDKWGMDYYLKYETIIPITIEFIINLSVNRVGIFINRKIKKCCII